MLGSILLSSRQDQHKKPKGMNSECYYMWLVALKTGTVDSVKMERIDIIILKLLNPLMPPASQKVPIEHFG